MMPFMFCPSVLTTGPDQNKNLTAFLHFVRTRYVIIAEPQLKLDMLIHLQVFG